MSLKEWEPDLEPLTFPIAGKTYVVPPISWKDGVRLTRILSRNEDVPEDEDEQNRLLLGSAWDAMKADNVPMEALNRAALTALIDFRMNREAAETYWNSGALPEAPAPQGATQTTTAEASTTKPPASTSGTSSPTKGRRSRSKAAASR